MKTPRCPARSSLAIRLSTSRWLAHRWLAHRWLACCLTASLAVALLGSGCEHNVYRLEMVPEGTGLKRELTVWRERSSEQGSVLVALPQPQLDAIAAAYQTAAGPTAASRYKFAGRFEKIPGDIGGAGSYFAGKTPMGVLHGYAERVRGNDDLSANVRERREAVDRLTDHLIGWLQSELGKHEEFARLRGFLDQRVRRDLHNLSLYSWTLGIAAEYQAELGPDAVARVGQYLIERGYIELRDLPGLVRAVREASHEQQKRLLTTLKKALLSGVAGAGESFTASVERLFADGPTLQGSLRRYLVETPDYQRLLKQWQQARELDPDAERPQPDQVLTEAIGQAVFSGLHLFGQTDELRVTLRVTTRPLATNGQWSEEAGQLEWLRKIEPADADSPGYPTLLFAAWTVPNREYQQKHFGRLVLEGERLGEYCIWYLGLDEAEAGQWDAMIAGIDLKQDLAGQIGAFRFAGEPPAGSSDAPPSLAAAAQELLRAALKE